MKKIHITSQLHGLEVAGMRHPSRTVTYTEDQITKTQLAEFKKSPYLTVEVETVGEAPADSQSNNNETDN